MVPEIPKRTYTKEMETYIVFLQHSGIIIIVSGGQSRSLKVTIWNC